MNAVTTTTAAKPTALDKLRMEILPPERAQTFYAGMPAHVKPERFMRNLDIALMQNTDLMQCDARLIFREISKAAALGLYLDPQLGEAYLIVGWNGKAKRKEPQLRIGYRGLIKLGRQSGEISQIYAHEVHANDIFKASLGDDKKLIHEPDIFGDRGSIVGYYAVVKYKDGDSDFEPLTIAQAHAIRDRSDGWKAFQAGKIKSTPWSTDELEMSKKTVIRRLVKRIPQSPELAEAARIEDSAEYHDVAPTPALQPPRPPVPPAFQIGQQEDVTDIEHEDAGVEEHAEAEVVDEETGEVIDQREIVEETGEQTDAVMDGGDTIGEYFERMDAAMSEAKDAADIAEVWTEFDPLARFEGDEENQALATSIKRRHVQRVGGGREQG
jgi:recombination protein RecT